MMITCYFSIVMHDITMYSGEEQQFSPYVTMDSSMSIFFTTSPWGAARGFNLNVSCYSNGRFLFVWLYE